MDIKELTSTVISALSEVTGLEEHHFNVSEESLISELPLDSMALFSVLLTIERKLGGNISKLPPNTPAPQTFGGLVQLAAKIGQFDHLIE